MKKILLVFLAAVFIAPILLFALDVPPANDIKIKKTGNTKTAVIYSHSKHASKIGAKAKDCTGCHNAVKSQNDAHKYCTDCHKTMKSGPILAKCNDCHRVAK